MPLVVVPSRRAQCVWLRWCARPAPRDHLHRGRAAPVGAVLLRDVGCGSEDLALVGVVAPVLDLVPARCVSGGDGRPGPWCPWSRQHARTSGWRAKKPCGQRDALDLVAEQPDLRHRAGGLGELGALRPARARRGSAGRPGGGRRASRGRRCVVAEVRRAAWRLATGGPPRRGPGPACGRSSRCRGSSAGPRRPRTARRRPRARAPTTVPAPRPAVGPASTTRSIVRLDAGGDPAVAGGRATRNGRRAPVVRMVPSSPPPRGTNGSRASEQDQGPETDPACARHGEDLETSGVTSPPLSTTATGESSRARSRRLRWLRKTPWRLSRNHRADGSVTAVVARL